MAHVSGNATWTNTVTTPASATTLENIEGQLDYLRPKVDAMWLPSDHGLIGWTYDPSYLSGTTVITPSGSTLCLFALKVGTTATATGLAYQIVTAGVGATTGNNWLGLYDPSFSLVASTADMSTTWTSTGTKSTPFASTVTVTPGAYVVGLISAWTTTSATFASINANLGAVNFNRSPFRGGAASGTFTTLPSTKPSSTSGVSPPWIGLY